MKKNNPGCLCCGELCDSNCYFPCGGSESANDCLVCGLDIQLPEPDVIGIDELLLPPESCPEQAPCFKCYQLLDRRFNLLFNGDQLVVQPGDDNTCENWDFTWLFPFAGINLGGGVIIRPGANNLSYYIYMAQCWEPQTYNCPYDPPENLPDCPTSKVALSTSWATPGLYDLVTLSGNTWDGECGKLTVTIQYTAVEFTLGTSVAPIEDPNACTDPKWTHFVHTFELEYCTCDEMFGVFNYVSTQTTDSCAGAVDDPCNVEDATIKLTRRSNSEEWCYWCECRNCDGYRQDQMTVTISGSAVNGTFLAEVESLVNFKGDCSYLYNVAVPGCEQVRRFRVLIRCLACDKFTAIIEFEHADGYVLYMAQTDGFDCGDTATFETLPSPNGEPPCGLESHTIQLSFVPA